MTTFVTGLIPYLTAITAWLSSALRSVKRRMFRMAGSRRGSKATTYEIWDEVDWEAVSRFAPDLAYLHWPQSHLEWSDGDGPHTGDCE